MLDQLLLVSERPSADVAIALQRVLLVVVDPLVLHPAAVAGKDGAALPAADVWLDARVRVQVPFHVSLEKSSQVLFCFSLLCIFLSGFQIIRACAHMAIY